MSFNTTYIKEDFSALEPTIVEDLNPSFLKYSQELEILICSSYKVAIINSKSIKKHLKEKQPTIVASKELLKTLESYSIKTYLESKTSIPYNTYYFKDLSLSLNNYKYYKCDFITTSYRKLRTHLVTIEGIKATSTNKREDIKNNIPL